ncbi:7TMR-DISM extracellular protein 2 [Lutibacter sp. Hel_I_33_5]|uniref:LuxR C-terminal-related transcriptional regulator n=1 Tax=Lutibacter sp. Hel_I_33_5 TaxID=1566289 RepID=UPI00119D9329|nr:LuxR C-terminal-related transcriptional regulator [Lutibacter sp. Hel_I_33_5]TVZ55205.1 7TMR-DISM extracellular protein 2 [Lutibacter sp. Hel_I_33_5]
MFNKHFKAFSFFMVLCIVLLNKTYAIETIKSDSINYTLTFFKEKSPTSLKEVLIKEFKKVPKSNNFGYKNGSYWYKLEIQKATYNKDYIIYVPTHNIEKIELFKLNGDKLEYIGKSGNSVQQNDLHFNFKFPAFKLNEKEKFTYYLKVDFPKEGNFPLKIVSEKNFLSDKLNKQSLISFFYGTCILILILNLLFYFKYKSKIYLYYIGFLFPVMINLMLIDGSLINIFRGNQFYYLIEIGSHLVMNVYLILFSLNFLELNKRVPKFSKLSILSPIIVAILYLLYLISNNYILVVLGDTIGLIIFPILWFLGLFYIRKAKYAKYYVIGYFFLIPIGVYYLLGLGYGEWYVDGEGTFIKVASWLDMIAFTFAINYRFKIRSQEKQKIIEELKEKLNLNNTQISKNKEIDPYFILLKKNDYTSEALTLKEIEILKLLIKGNSNNEIGNKLFISNNTVKYHIRNIYQKVNVKSRESLKEKISASIT